MVEKQARLKISVSGWMEGDQDLLRHALEFEEKIKQKALDEEQERLQEATNALVMEQVRSVLLRHTNELLNPSIVPQLEVEVRYLLAQLEEQAGIPERLRIAQSVQLELDPNDPSSLNITVPKALKYITLDFIIGGPVVVEEATKGQELEEDEH
jgi:hypothetical protein